jgi:flagellar hook-associated protein 1 FlgK
MSSLFALLGTMGNAMMAQQAGLDVTGQNVANASTAGYTSETAELETSIDGGVQVNGVASSYDAFTFGQVVTQTGLSGAANARSEALQEAQAVLDPQGGGDIGTQMNSFFASFNALSASPSDPSARTAVLSDATQLAQSISTTATGLQQQQASMLSNATGIVSQVNGDLGRIAQLNGEISQAQGLGNSTADLCDQRDTLVTSVASALGAQVVPDASGSITLFAGGTTLVDGTDAATLGVSLGASGAMKFTATTDGGSPDDITAGVTTGSLGGIREARDTDVQASVNQLDQFAYDLAGAVNGVQQSGYGLDGITGRPLFTPPASVAGAAAGLTVDPSVAGNPSAIAASSTAGGLPGGNDGAVALAQLADEPLGSASTPAAAFAQISSALGSAAQAASTDASTRADTLTQAQNLDSSASGVSLEQETATLTQFQDAFQASAQVLQVTSTLMTDLMNTMSTALE